MPGQDPCRSTTLSDVVELQTVGCIGIGVYTYLDLGSVEDGAGVTAVSRTGNTTTGATATTTTNSSSSCLPSKYSCSSTTNLIVATLV